MKVKIHDQTTTVATEKDKQFLDMLNEEFMEMEDSTWDKPLIVGKRDRNKPVMLDQDPDFDGEVKDPVMERVNRQVEYLKKTLSMDDALAKHYYYKIKREELELEEKKKIYEE